MRLPTLFRAALAIAFLGASARGEPPSAKRDLGDLVAAALSNNPSTRAAWFRALAAESAVGEARAPYWPRLMASFSGGADRGYTPAATAPDNFHRQSVTATLALEYVLLDFGRRASDVNRTLAAMDAAGFAFDRNLQNVVFAVQRAYFAHEAAVWSLAAARVARDSAATDLETIHREAAAGLADDPQVAEAVRAARESEYEVAAAEAAVRNTRGALCVAAGLPANTPLEIPAGDGPPPAAGLLADVGHLIDLAVAGRPDLLALAADVRAAEAGERRARADFWPEVRISASYSSESFRYDAKDGKVAGRYGEHLNGYTAFLEVGWDLFDGFERTERLRRRKAETEAARAALDDARLRASNDVWSAFNDQFAASREVAYTESLVAAGEESFAAAEAAFKNDLLDIAAFDAARTRLADSKSARAGAVAAHSTALAALANAIGADGLRGPMPP